MELAQDYVRGAFAVSGVGPYHHQDSCTYSIFSTGKNFSSVTDTRSK
jgi:hypothetical protein